MIDKNEILSIVLKQLNNFWLKTDRDIIASAIPEALHAMGVGFNGIPNSRFFDGKEIVFSPYFSIHWMIFLYRLSNAIYRLNMDSPPQKPISSII